MKVFKYILRLVVWGMVLLSLLLLILPRIPSVQYWLGEKTELILSDLLHTDVHVGRVDLGFVNRVIVDDVKVMDKQQKELLRINRLSAQIDVLALAEGKVSISSAQLFGAHASLYRTDSLSVPNYQFVIDALSSKDTVSSSAIDLRINSFIMRRSSVTYDEWDAPVTPDVLNPRHLRVTDISAHMILKVLTEDSLNVNVKRLALKEQSGLSLDKLSFKAEAGHKHALISNLLIQLPRTQFRIESLAAEYDDARFKETCQLEGTIANTFLTPSDFKCLVPQLANYLYPISLDLRVAGSLDQMNIHRLNLQSEHDELALRANGWIGLAHEPVSAFAHVYELSVSERLLGRLQQDFHLPELLAHIGRAEMTGDVSCDAGCIESTCRVETERGNLSLNMQTFSNQGFTGHVETDGLDLKTLLDNEDLGLLATKVDVSGVLSAIKVKGEVAHLDYKGYPYHNILIDGNYADDEIAGKLKLDDPNVLADVEGFLRKNNKTMSMRLTGLIQNLTPQALHLSDQWGAASFNAIVDADFMASSLNDAQGTIDIDDFEMTDSMFTYHIENVHVKSGFDEGKHYLKIHGDMGEAELKGRFDWATLPQSFVDFVANKLPTLPGLPDTSKPTDNDFDISLRLYDTEWLRRLFSVPLELNHPFHLDASVNDQDHEISLHGSLPDFTYDGNPYYGGDMMITSPADSLKCDISLTKQMENGQRMDLQLHAIAADNNLSTTFIWDNKGEDVHEMSGMLQTITQFYKNGSDIAEAHVRVLPSQLVVAGAIWNIEPSDILYSAQHLLVDHFLIAHGSQHLLIDGIASRQISDTLTVDLNDMEVAYVLDLVNFHSVEFSGEATGKVYLTNLFEQPAAWTNLTVRQFQFEKGRMGTLYARAEWNEHDEQIDITATADDGPEAMTYINGYVSPQREYIDLDIHGRGTYIEFMNSFSSSFLSDVTGHGYGDLKLAGPLSTINLTGDLAVDGMATVTALGTTYTLAGDTVHFIPDDILLDSIQVHDRYGNVAYLSGGIHHKHLTSLTFDLDVVTSNLLAYDFHDFGENTFYGTVFAKGRVDLHGRPGEVTINCDVTPQKNTTFTYNAASVDAISNQEFITWHDAAIVRNKPDRISHDEEEEPDDSPTDIYINFLINTIPDAEMRLLMDDKTGDYITLYGSGVIRASFYNKGTFQMFGTYVVDHGTYGITIQNIIKKNFTFEEGGTIVFGGNPFDANLNLQAVYTVNGVSLSDLSIGNSFTGNTVRVNCLMNILGLAGAPRVEFDLDMPTVSSDEKQMIRSVMASEQEMNQQVLYLLGIGRFYTQGNNNATTQQYNQTSLAMQSFLSGTVSTQINEVLSQVIKSNDWNFGANISTGNEGWHNAEYEGLVSGRMLNNRLLINGQFGYRDNATQANPSFIGDFDIRYLLYPSGNLALKVYDQTNDRYFTRSSLNTQGIGLIMKKDFNGLGDLLFPKRKRENGKKSAQE